MKRYAYDQDQDDDTDIQTSGAVRRYRCRHVFADGRRCASPSLRNEPFCFYHHTSRGAAAIRLARSCHGLQPSLPDACDLAERSGIQLAIGEVLHLIASNDIDLRRAGLLLYGLQTASNNLPRPNPKAEPTQPVDEITIDPELGPIALPAELERPPATRKRPRPAHARTMGPRAGSSANGTLSSYYRDQSRHLKASNE